jgi:hypothetical protein
MKTTVIHNSKPPLRWFANFVGEINGTAIWKIAMLDEDNNFGLKYKVYSYIYKVTYPIYQKWGTFYEINSFAEEFDENLEEL